MNRRLAATLVLLVAGSGVLFVLQKRHAQTEITPRPLLYLVADTEREAERLPLALTRVSDEEEMRVGRELIAGAGFSSPNPSDAEAFTVQNYLNDVGRRVARHVHRTGIQYEFHYVSGDYFVNAQALPGGHVLFGRGLLKLLGTEDELAAILGHEIAHVDQRHSIERLQYELKSRQLGLGGVYRLGSLGVQLFQVGYTKEQELEADRIGLEFAVAAGYSPAGAVNAMRRLESLHQYAENPQSSPAEEMVGVPLQALREYFRSHPPEQERIAAFERQISREGWNRSQPERPLAVKDLLTSKGPAQN